MWRRQRKQEYIGALPPGPAPPEGDWFARLLERWGEVQQQIEKPAAKQPSEGERARRGILDGCSL